MQIKKSLCFVVLRSTPVRAGPRFPKPLAPLPLSKHAGVSGMPTTHARYPRICSAIVTIFLGELPEVSKANMEYFLQIIFSNGERGERVLGRAKKTVDFAMRDLRTVTCVL